MKTVNDNYEPIGRVALMLDISSHTIKRWYKWWENDNFVKPKGLYLPPYYFKDRRKTKFFKKEDIMHLKEFRNKIQTTYKGAMAEFNAAYQWGKRGKQALKNKGTTPKDVKDRIG